jgi:GT2 family glycosyltransferase
MIVRREVIDRVGLMDEGFFLYCEDSDWIARMRKAGYTIGCAPDVRIIHHHGTSSRQNEMLREITAVKSTLRYFAKHCNSTTVVLFRLALSSIMIVRIISLDLYRALVKRSLAKIKRDWEILKCAIRHRVGRID